MIQKQDHSSTSIGHRRFSQNGRSAQPARAGETIDILYNASPVSPETASSISLARHQARDFHRLLKEMQALHDLFIRIIVALSPGRFLVEYPLLRRIGLSAHPRLERLLHICAERVRRADCLGAPVRSAVLYHEYGHVDRESAVKAFIAQEINGDMLANPDQNLLAELYSVLQEMGIVISPGGGIPEDGGALAQWLWHHEQTLRFELEADLKNLRCDRAAGRLIGDFDPERCLRILHDAEELMRYPHQKLKTGDLPARWYVEMAARLQDEIEGVQVLCEVLDEFTGKRMRSSALQRHQCHSSRAHTWVKVSVQIAGASMARKEVTITMTT